jgi:hypothetical protein
MTSSTNPDDLAWLAATSVTIVLLALVLGAWARQRPTLRGRMIAGAGSAVLGAALLLVLVAPTDIPIGWITVLQEGRSARNIQQLYGLGTHAGPGFAAFVDSVAGHGPNALRSVVRANVCLAVVDTIVLFSLASAVVGSWWASLGFAAAWLLSLSTINAALSETPAMIWALHFWLACVAAAVVADRDASRGLRWLALVTLALLVVLATWLRIEAVVVGLPALAIGVAHVIGAEERLQQAVRKAGHWLQTIVMGPLGAFLAVAVALLALEYVPIPESLRWVVAALRPLNFSFLTWLQALTFFFPFAIVLLLVLGAIHGVRRWFAFFLLPITVVMLLKMYAAGSHGAFLDKFRYVALVTPFVVFLSLFGFRELSDWAARLGWPAWWKRVAVLLLVATIPAFNPWQREFFGRRHELHGLMTPASLLARNQQTEVRYLLDLVARYPRCVFVAKAPLADSVSDATTGHRWLAFGTALDHPKEAADAGRGVEQIAAQLAPDSPCVLFYRSLDCDLVGFDGCTSETAGRIPIEERALENLPYSEIREYGAHRAEIRLGVFPVVVRDRSVLSAANAAPSSQGR